MNRNPLVALFALVLLTQADGSRLAINAGEVMAVFESTSGIYTKSCQTVIVVHDSRYCVAESFDEVIEKVESSK